jgi:hypothetical protein
VGELNIVGKAFLNCRGDCAADASAWRGKLDERSTAHSATRPAREKADRPDAALNFALLDAPFAPP